MLVWKVQGDLECSFAAARDQSEGDYSAILLLKIKDQLHGCHPNK